jgi:hypothetical protein
MTWAILIFIYARKHGLTNIFSEEEEELLKDYLLKAAQMCYGLTQDGTRELAYKYAIANEKNIPVSWTANKKAGMEWMTSRFIS